MFLFPVRCMGGHFGKKNRTRTDNDGQYSPKLYHFKPFQCLQVSPSCDWACQPCSYVSVPSDNSNSCVMRKHIGVIRMYIFTFRMPIS